MNRLFIILIFTLLPFSSIFSQYQIKVLCNGGKIAYWVSFSTQSECERYRKEWQYYGKDLSQVLGKNSPYYDGDIKITPSGISQMPMECTQCVQSNSSVDNKSNSQINSNPSNLNDVAKNVITYIIEGLFSSNDNENKPVHSEEYYKKENNYRDEIFDFINFHRTKKEINIPLPTETQAVIIQSDTPQIEKLKAKVQKIYGDCNAELNDRISQLELEIKKLQAKSKNISSKFKLSASELEEWGKLTDSSFNDFRSRVLRIGIDAFFCDSNLYLKLSSKYMKCRPEKVQSALKLYNAGSATIDNIVTLFTQLNKLNEFSNTSDERTGIINKLKTWSPFIETTGQMMSVIPKYGEWYSKSKDFVDNAYDVTVIMMGLNAISDNNNNIYQATDELEDVQFRMTKAMMEKNMLEELKNRNNCENICEEMQKIKLKIPIVPPLSKNK